MSSWIKKEIYFWIVWKLSGSSWCELFNNITLTSLKRVAFQTTQCLAGTGITLIRYFLLEYFCLLERDFILVCSKLQWKFWKEDKSENGTTFSSMNTKYLAVPQTTLGSRSHMVKWSGEVKSLPQVTQLVKGRASIPNVLGSKIRAFSTTRLTLTLQNNTEWVIIL